MHINQTPSGPPRGPIPPGFEKTIIAGEPWTIDHQKSEVPSRERKNWDDESFIDPRSLGLPGYPEAEVSISPGLGDSQLVDRLRPDVSIRPRPGDSLLPEKGVPDFVFEAPDGESRLDEIRTINEIRREVQQEEEPERETRFVPMSTSSPADPGGPIAVPVPGESPDPDRSPVAVGLIDPDFLGGGEEPPLKPLPVTPEGPGLNLVDGLRRTLTDRGTPRRAD